MTSHLKLITYATDDTQNDFEFGNCWKENCYLLVILEIYRVILSHRLKG